MTARTRSTLGPSDGRRRGAQSDDKKPGEKPGEPPAERESIRTRLGWTTTPLRLRLALLLSAAGAVLTYLGVRQVVAGEPPPAFHSMALLLAIAVAPALLACASVVFGRAPTAAGILVGAALLAPGLALVDAQFIHEALDAARPEVMVPTSLAPLPPATGAYLLLAGHLAVALAGLLAAGRAGADPDSDYHAALDATASTAGRGKAVGWALAAGTISVIGLLSPPFQSDNAFIVADDLIGSPPLVRFGGLLIVLTLLIGGVTAAANTRPAIGRGMALGLLLALCWLVLPQLVAVAALDWISLDWGGPLFALIPIALLAAVLVVVGDDQEGDRGAVELRANPLRIAAGVLGVLAGLAALFATFGTLVVAEIEGFEPGNYATRQLLPVGILVILLSGALFTRWAGAVRPALVVALAAVPLVGLAALDTAFTATTVGNLVPGITVSTTETHVGSAVWFVVIAFVFAAAAAVTAVVAGGAERDEVDLTRRVFHTRYGLIAGGALIFAVVAFGSPVIKAPDFTPPGIWTEFRLASWGLLIGLLVVAAAIVVAAFARPLRAGALLLGAAVVTGVHLLQLPLTGDRVDGAQAGNGTWFSLACLVALVAAAVAALSDPARNDE